MGPNGFMRIHTLTDQTNPGNSKTFRLEWNGGNNVIASAAGYNVGSTHRITLIQNRGSASSQVHQGQAAESDPGESSVGAETMAINTDSDITVTTSIQMSVAGDEFSQESILIEVCYKP